MMRTQKIAVEENQASSEEIRYKLQTVSFALRKTTNTTTKYSPRELALGRDMIIHVKETAEWSLIRESAHIAL